jgi:hypothetical protein
VANNRGKIVRLHQDTYDRLNTYRRPNESFNELLHRLLKVPYDEEKQPRLYEKHNKVLVTDEEFACINNDSALEGGDFDEG